MISPRKVDNKDPIRHKVLEYLRKHPKEMKYIIGDYLAKHPETIKNIIKKHSKKEKKWTNT